jgi:NAD(P)-dependent dehydrogenase (short-subunit alcohol dehydrogenase family)
MSVNFWGVFHGMHVFIPRMKDQPGQIISAGAKRSPAGDSAAH